MPKYACQQNCCEIIVTEDAVIENYYRHGNNRKSGCFIYDPDEDRVLLVQSRSQLWGFPKGTFEPDVDTCMEDCAIREVKEETGLDVYTSEFKSCAKIKNKALYYYIEKKRCPVNVQTHDDPSKNDATGIAWIRIDCLQECILTGQITLNQHTRMMFEKFLKKVFTPSESIKVEKRRKRKRKETV